jgi:hypothetical protein
MGLRSSPASHIGIFILSSFTDVAGALLDRCAFKNDSYWYDRDENLLLVHNLTVDTRQVEDTSQSNGVRNVSRVHLSIISPIWDGIMDCDAWDHGVQTEHYLGNPEDGLIYDDCTPRAGFEADRYWLQVAALGMTVGTMTGSAFHGFVFNETFTCDEDPNSVYVLSKVESIYGSLPHLLKY